MTLNFLIASNPSTDLNKAVSAKGRITSRYTTLAPSIEDKPALCAHMSRNVMPDGHNIHRNQHQMIEVVNARIDFTNRVEDSELA
jgi:hypothetical protein